MKHCRWIALLLVLIVLLSACDGNGLLYDNKGKSFAELFSTIHSDQRLIPFPDMPYERPDENTMKMAFETTAKLAEEGQDYDALIIALKEAREVYDEFYTLDNIALIRADADQTDPYYSEEYAFCEQLQSQVEQWQEKMMQACAASPLRRALERDGYVQIHELDYYENSDDYNDEMVELYQRESELISAYRERISNPQILLNGQRVNLNEYLMGDLTEEEYNEAYRTYLLSINEDVGDIFCSLVRLRKQIAEKSGYASYEQLQYDYYGRDYTPEEVGIYLDSIRDHLAPYRETVVYQGMYDERMYPSLSENQIMDLLEKSMKKLGTPASSTFEMMKQYSLYNIVPNFNKAASSYTVFLNSYGVPYMFVNAYGDVEDIMTASHEFGHFLAANTQENSAYTLDIDETVSQGMEYLTLYNMNTFMNKRQYEALARIKLLDTLDTYTMQAACATFERAVYSLNDDELNTNKLNELSRQCFKSYGCVEFGEQNSGLYWTEIQHFFELPFYVLSYCTSVDVAMQLYRQELCEEGTGWTAYQKLMSEAGYPFLTAISYSGLENPLEEGHVKQMLAVLQEQLEK